MENPMPMSNLLRVASPYAALVCAVAFDASAHAATLDRWELGGPGGWDYLTVDVSAHRLFVTRSDRVLVIDTTNGKTVATIPGTEGVHGVALAPRRGKGYTSNGRADNVTEFDLKTLAVLRTFPVSGHNPDAIVFDEPSGHVFTFNGKSHDATVLDAASGRTLATIALDGKPEFAVSDGHGRIYVNDEDHARLNVIDVHRNAVVATWNLDNCEEPSGLAFDRVHGRLFSVCSNGEMAVTDAKTGRHVASVPIGKGPDAVVFDPSRHEIFSSNGEDGTVTAVKQSDADHYAVASTLDTQKSARTAALDPSTHRLYLAAAEFEPQTETPGQPKKRPAVKGDTFSILVLKPGDAAKAKAP
jgi:DNA-binding beta-propeller fold protein YncE